MAWKVRRTFLLILTIGVLLFSSVIASFGERAQYVYDDLNRLMQIRYGNGTFIDYSYDQAGNRVGGRIEDVEYSGR